MVFLAVHYSPYYLNEIEFYFLVILYVLFLDLVLMLFDMLRLLLDVEVTGIGGAHHFDEHVSGFSHSPELLDSSIWNAPYSQPVLSQP